MKIHNVKEFGNNGRELDVCPGCPAESRWRTGFDGWETSTDT